MERASRCLSIEGNRSGKSVLITRIILIREWRLYRFSKAIQPFGIYEKGEILWEKREIP